MSFFPHFFFYRKVLSFFLCLLNFRVHALQSELNKDGYTNFGNLGKEQLDTFDNWFDVLKAAFCDSRNVLLNNPYFFPIKKIYIVLWHPLIQVSLQLIFCSGLTLQRCFEFSINFFILEGVCHELFDVCIHQMHPV